MINIIANRLFVRGFCTVKNLPAVTLYSKSESCSLCEDAKEALMKHTEKFTFEEVDITAAGNEHWYEMYKYDIPVVHINNVKIMQHQVFEPVLLDSLKQAQQSQT